MCNFYFTIFVFMLFCHHCWFADQYVTLSIHDWLFIYECLRTNFDFKCEKVFDNFDFECLIFLIFYRLISMHKLVLYILMLMGFERNSKISPKLWKLVSFKWFDRIQNQQSISKLTIQFQCKMNVSTMVMHEFKLYPKVFQPNILIKKY